MFTKRDIFKLCVAAVLLLSTVMAVAQNETDWGCILRAEYQVNISKPLNLPIRNDKLDITVKEDLRFENNMSRYSRSKTTLGVDYKFTRLGIKLGAGFEYINRYTNKFIYRNRYRYFFNLSYEYAYRNWEFGFRTRFITMYNDEARGYYNYKARYYWRNKLVVAYKQPNSRFKYSLSGEMYTEINKDRDLQLNTMMYEGSVDYRLTRRQYLSVFVRDYRDIYITDDQIRTVFFGLGWKFKH